MTSRGSVAEGILLKMLLQDGIEAKHGSPSRPGDTIVWPNVIIEVKGPNASSYSFKQNSGKGEAQWKALKGIKEMFPWLEIYYVVRFNRREWRFFKIPEKLKPLRLIDGSDMSKLFSLY